MKYDKEPSKLIHPDELHPNYIAKYWHKFLWIAFITIVFYIGAH